VLALDVGHADAAADGQLGQLVLEEPGGEHADGGLEEAGFEDLAADVGVQADQVHRRGARRPVEGRLGGAGVDAEAELRVVLSGLDVLVGVGLDAGGEADEHLGRGDPFAHEGLDAVHLVERVDDDAPDALGQGAAQLVGGLVVAVQHEPVGGHARGAGDVVLPRRGHVEVHALLVDQAGHGGAEEGLGGVVDAGTEGGHRLAGAGAQVGLVVDEEGGAELGGQRERVAAADVQPTGCVDGGRVGQEVGGQRGHIDSGAVTPSRSRPMARPISAASTSHRRAWVRSGGVWSEMT
jgi:hypothetical protein